MKEYCVIYGCNDNDPGPFIVGVTTNQAMINGFREEHYHFCRGGEVLVDSFYDNISADYEIQYTMGHYMTPIMISEFTDYLISVYNMIFKCVDNIENDIDNLKFTEDEREIVDDGFGLVKEHLENLVYNMNINYTYGSEDALADSIYAELLNIPLCLERFLSTYQPKNGLI